MSAPSATPQPDIPLNEQIAVIQRLRAFADFDWQEQSQRTFNGIIASLHELGVLRQVATDQATAMVRMVAQIHELQRAFENQVNRVSREQERNNDTCASLAVAEHDIREMGKQIKDDAEHIADLEREVREARQEPR